MAAIEPFQPCIDQLQKLPPADLKSKKLYFHLEGEKLSLTANFKERSNLAEVAAFIDAKMNDVKPKDLDPRALEALKKVEDFYNQCNETRVKKVSGSLWVRCFGWAIALFKPKEYFTGIKLNHHLETHLKQKLEEQQSQKRTKETLLGTVRHIYNLVHSSNLIQRAAVSGVALPTIAPDLTEQIRHADGMTLTKLRNEIGALKRDVHAASGQVLQKEAAAKEQIVIASASSAQIKAQAAALIPEAQDAPHVLAEQAQKAALHIEMAPQFESFCKGVKPLAKRAEELQQQIGKTPALATFAKEVAKVVDRCIRLPIEPESLTQEKLAERKSEKEALETAVKSLQGQVEAHITKLEAEFAAQKEKATQTLASIRTSLAEIPHPIPRITELIAVVEKKLEKAANKMEPFDTTIAPELASIARELVKLAATLPDLETSLHYYALAKAHNPELAPSLLLQEWQQSGNVADLSLLKVEHKATLLPIFLKKKSVAELEVLVNDPWIAALDAKNATLTEIADKTKLQYTETLSYALDTLSDPKYREELQARFSQEIPGKTVAQLQVWEGTVRAVVTQVNQQTQQLKILETDCREYLAVVSLLRELYKAKTGHDNDALAKAQIALEASPGATLESLQQRITNFETSFKDIAKELQRPEWQTVATGERDLQVAARDANIAALKPAAEALIKRINDENKKLAQIQADWAATKESFLKEIQSKRAEYRGSDVKNRLARELLDERESIVLKSAIPASLSLTLDAALSKFQASKAAFGVEFSKTLETDSKKYTTASTAYTRAKTDAAAVLKKASLCFDAAALISIDISSDLEREKIQLEQLVQAIPDAALIRKKTEEMNRLGKEMSHVTTPLQKLYDIQLPLLKTKMEKKFALLKDGLTACKRACKNSDFRNAIAVPASFARNKPIADQAKQLHALASELETAQRIKRQDAVWTQYAERSDASYQKMTPVLQEAVRLQECFSQVGALKLNPLAALLAESVDALKTAHAALQAENHPPLDKIFDSEIEKRALLLTKLEASLPAHSEVSSKAKKAFDDYAAAQLLTIQGEINKTTDILRRIEGKKEGFQERLALLQGRLSEARGANWANELTNLVDESKALHNALIKVLDVAQREMQAKRDALGFAEIRVLRSLGLNEASLQAPDVLKDTITVAVQTLSQAGVMKYPNVASLARKTLDARLQRIAKELASDPVAQRRVIGLIFELQCMTANTQDAKKVTTILQLRELIGLVAAFKAGFTPAAEKAAQEFFGVANIGELAAHIVNPNRVMEITAKQLNAKKAELLQVLSQTPAAQKIIQQYSKELQ